MERAAASLRTVCSDLNGQMRGNRVAAARLPELKLTGIPAPRALVALDLWGDPVEDGPLGPPMGQADGQLRQTERDPVELPWLRQKATMVPMWMHNPDGSPFLGDPRHALARILQRYSKRNWHPEVSATLEFTLAHDGSGIASLATGVGPAPPESQRNDPGRDPNGAYSALTDAILAGAQAMRLPVARCSSDGVLGQMTIDLAPAPAMQAADDLWQLKTLVRETADNHGLCATFMAKPFVETPSRSLHLRFLIRDSAGRNLFDNGLMSGSALMRQAVAGCLSGMAGSTLIYAPYGNSYSRLDTHGEAPAGACWGYENRTTALRIPGGDPKDRRIENRAPGADSNPYLAIAATLGTALMGVEDDLSPPESIIGDAHGQRVLQTPTEWSEAIDRFEASPRMARIFSGVLIDLFVALKRQEKMKLSRLTEGQQTMSLLRTA